jgi:polysaccharide biosynthesis protein PelF
VIVAMYHPLPVLLTTEGTYPFFEGGVSTWCDTLIRQLPEYSFTVLSLTAQPGLRPAWSLPPNVARCLPVPLWGTGGANELRRDVGWHALLQLRWRLARRATDDAFAEPFDRLLSGLLGEAGDLDQVGQGLARLAAFFRTHDYDATFRRPLAWSIFQEHVDRCTVARRDAPGWPPRQLEVAEALRLLYRWLTPLALPLPPARLVHASAAGIASLPGIVARIERGTPFLLTEHGVYVRERLLAWTNSDDPPFTRFFVTRVIRRLVELSYKTADLLTPVSWWNARWEQRLGAPPERIQVIANGADAQRFAPRPLPDPATPTLVWVGRIDPLKDLITLIEAAALIRQAIPNVRVLLFGKAPVGNEAYEAACRARQHELGLDQTLEFKGFASNPQDAYAQGHAVVLSSRSEGQPFSVIEAMLCGRPVVGTDAGGVREVISETGRVVQPCDPAALADACVEVLRDPALCADLGMRARERSLKHYTRDRMGAAYRTIYQRLARGAPAQAGLPEKREQTSGNDGSYAVVRDTA